MADVDIGVRRYQQPLCLSLFPRNSQTSLWLQLSFSLTSCFYPTALTSVWDISQGLVKYLQTKRIWKFIALAFQKITCIPHSLFFTRVVNMEKLKYFSLMGRKRLWTFYWFKIQTNIIWSAEFESQDSRKTSSRMNITYEVVFPK